MQNGGARMPLLFVGDFLFDLEECPADLAQLGERFRAEGRRVVLNLEGPLVGARPLRGRDIILGQSESLVPALRTLNTVAADLANNHILDWGADGLARTLAALDEAGIAHFGAGMDRDAACRLQIVVEAGRRVGLLGFGWSVEESVPATARRPGVAPLVPARVLAAIRASRPRVDFLVVCFHWGYEFERLPLPAHRELARQAVDCGADLILGHHPHVVQAIETWRQKRIFYSLGNFFFGSRRDDFLTLNPIAARHSQTGLGVALSFEPTLSVEPVFFEYEGGRTQLRAAPAALEDLSALSSEAYDAWFAARRTIGWRPTLRAGRLQRPLNALRLAGFDARVRLSKLARAVGLQAPLRRLAAALRGRARGGGGR